MRRVAAATIAVVLIAALAVIVRAAPQQAACVGAACAYLPIAMKPVEPTTTPTATVTSTLPPGPTSTPTATAAPTIGPTATPTLPPPSYHNCQADPNPTAAPNYPVAIVAINKSAETVTLRNVSTDTISLTNWAMCSITGNQHHPIFGTLAPGQTVTFPGPAGNIWNNSASDPGALYTPSGQLVSYFFD